MARVTGCLIVVPRKSGDVYFLKLRDREGRQIKEKLGPVAEWTHKAAEDALRDRLTDLGRTPERGEHVGFRYAAEAWLQYIEHDRARMPSTVSDYRNTVRRHLVRRFGDQPIDEITTDAIDVLRGELLKAGLSHRTAQKVLVLLHGILTYAKRRHWIATNPADEAERVTVRRRTEFAVLSPDEVHEVARMADDEQLGALIIVAAFTGLRLGELRALRWRDVEFGNRLVHVRRAYTRGKEGPPKSHLARSVPLIDQAARVLNDLSRRPSHVGAGDRVFCDRTGHPLAEEPIRDGFYAALERAGIDRDRGTGKLLVWHDLRHVFGTLAVRALPLSDVQAYMGHANVQTTMIYVHHTPQHEAADRLGAVVAGDGAWVPAGTQLTASEAI